MVGRTGPIASDFGFFKFDVRDALVCPSRVSFRMGLAIPKVLGTGVLTGCKFELPLAGSTGAWLFSRSAASAPAIRICSVVS